MNTGLLDSWFRRRALWLFLPALAGLAIVLGRDVMASRSEGFSHRLTLDLEAFGELQPGDLVFRKGTSLSSRAVLAADGASPYSHVGIADLEDGELYVIHAAPGEDSEASEPLLRESLADFLGPERAIAGAVYRPVEDGEIGTLAARAARSYFERGLVFDPKLDLESSEALYCTELVWKAHLDAGYDLMDSQPSEFETFLIRGPVILPSDLLGSSKIRPIHVFRPEERPDAETPS